MMRLSQYSDPGTHYQSEKVQAYIYQLCKLITVRMGASEGTTLLRVSVGYHNPMTVIV